MNVRASEETDVRACVFEMHFCDFDMHFCDSWVVGNVPLHERERQRMRSCIRLVVVVMVVEVCVVSSVRADTNNQGPPIRSEERTDPSFS